MEYLIIGFLALTNLVTFLKMLEYHERAIRAEAVMKAARKVVRAINEQ